MNEYSVVMGTTNLKFDDLDISCSDIYNRTNRLISEYTKEELYEKIINDSYFSGMFYTFLKSNKTYILNEVIEKYYDAHSNALYNESMKPFVEFLVGAKNHNLFRGALVNFFKEDYLNEFLDVLFISKNSLEEKFNEIKVVLKDEKDILDEETYKNILKEEFLNSLNTL